MTDRIVSQNLVGKGALAPEARALDARTLVDRGLDRGLVELAASEPSVGELLRRGLEWVGRVAQFDLATLFLLQDGRLVATAARGPLASAKVREHVLRLQ